MRYEHTDVVREYVTPVLLGGGLAAHRLAARLYAECGVVSLILDESRHLLDRLDPFCRFFEVCDARHGALLCEQLAYIGRDSDELLILIPCNEAYEAFVEKYRAELGCRMLLRTPQTALCDNPLSVFRRARQKQEDAHGKC